MATYAAYRHVELDHVGYGKRRVLKPPGGGSSDIFGTTEQQQSPRKVKQYMASNVILSDDVPPSSGPGSTASSTSSSGSAPDTPSSPTRNGNPVTGEGYAQQNGQGKSNGSPAPSAPRSRVPPGGYSSGLW